MLSDLAGKRSCARQYCKAPWKLGAGRVSQMVAFTPLQVVKLAYTSEQRKYAIIYGKLKGKSGSSHRLRKS